jgi:hypothetical protein
VQRLGGLYRWALPWSETCCLHFQGSRSLARLHWLGGCGKMGAAAPQKAAL